MSGKVGDLRSRIGQAETKRGEMARIKRTVLIGVAVAIAIGLLAWAIKSATAYDRNKADAAASLPKSTQPTQPTQQAAPESKPWGWEWSKVAPIFFLVWLAYHNHWWPFSQRTQQQRAPSRGVSEKDIHNAFGDTYEKGYTDGYESGKRFALEYGKYATHSNPCRSDPWCGRTDLRQYDAQYRGVQYTRGKETGYLQAISDFLGW